jgi:hypothetical protein
MSIYDSYTQEDLDVFRECFILLKQGCKNNTEAEKKLGIKFWWLSPFKIYTLVKKWFNDREKIDAYLKELDSKQILLEQNEQHTTENSATYDSSSKSNNSLL